MGHLGFASLVHIQNKAKLCLSASLGEAQFCTSPELGNTSKLPLGGKKKTTHHGPIKDLLPARKFNFKLDNSLTNLQIYLQLS